MGFAAGKPWPPSAAAGGLGWDLGYLFFYRRTWGLGVLKRLGWVMGNGGEGLAALLPFIKGQDLFCINGPD